MGQGLKVRLGVNLMGEWSMHALQEQLDKLAILGTLIYVVGQYSLLLSRKFVHLETNFHPRRRARRRASLSGPPKFRTDRSG